MEVNIMNILSTPPHELAQWISENILDLKLPKPGINTTIDVQTEVLPVLIEATNRLSFITGLYSMCVGAKAPWSQAKKNPDKKSEAETVITVISASIDILYRTIQTLDAIRESATSLSIGMTQSMRMSRS
jgi:hypothetical protein